MPRFYIKNEENKWNIFSTIIDDLLLDKWVEYIELERYVCSEVYINKQKEMRTLLTDKPELNIMSYEEYIKIKDKEK